MMNLEYSVSSTLPPIKAYTTCAGGADLSGAMKFNG